jgi:hypothetical protein
MQDLIKNVRDYFQGLYGTNASSLAPTDLFFAFEEAGQDILSSDFVLTPSDSSPNPAIVEEYASHLVDFSVQLDTDGSVEGRGDLSPTITGQYDQLLAGAQPGAGSDISAFLALKGRARLLFDGSRKNLHSTDLWPAALSPQFWFDDRDPSPWRTYSFTKGDSTGTDRDQPKPKIPMQLPLPRWRWRVITPEVRAKWALAEPPQPAPITPVSGRVKSAIAASSVLAAKGVAVEERVGVVEKMSAARMAGKSLRFHPELSPGRSVLFNQRVMRDAVRALPTQPVSSTELSMRFDYRIVEVRRPWLSAEFLNSANWFASGLPARSVAAGSYAGTAGRLDFVPVKFVVVKNLSITARWADEDRAFAAGDAASLGPFSLVYKRFENDTLSCPGLQIIAWFCQIMPPLPPFADPQLPAPSPHG